MLSRTAENLYWLARYVERAEYLARTIEATLRVTASPSAYIGKTNEWDSALLTAGVSAGFYQVYDKADEYNVIEYLSFAPENPSSIRNCIESARLNSRSVRTALTSEMWDTINSAWIDLQKVWGKGAKTREELANFLRFVQETSLRFDGSAYRTMLRNDAYWFSRLGLHLERADNTARILDQIGVAYGRQGAAQRHARGIRNRLEHSHMVDIFQHGVHEFIQEFIVDNSRLGEIITKQYLV